MKPSTDFPLGFLILAIALMICVSMGLSWETYTSFRVAQDVHGRYLRLQKLSGVIVHLDEVLTMSARMAAVTGDPRWEARYRRSEPRLDAAIQESKALAAEHFTPGNTAGTDAANAKLVEMENRAFEHVRAGDLASAGALLSGNGYQVQKAAYSGGIQALLGEIELDNLQRIRREGSRAVWTVGVSLGALVVSLFSWLAVVRGLRRGKTTLQATVAARRQAEEKLQFAYDDLETRIEARTAELRTANLSLRTEMDHRSMAQEALEASERRMRLSLDGALDAVMTLDGQGKVLDWNPQAARLFGWNQPRSAGILFLEECLAREEDRQGLRDCLRRGEGDLLGRRVELDLCAGAKKRFPAELAIIPIQTKAGALFCAFVRDISELKRVGRMKDEFISTVSHELRTPLTSIRGALGLIASGVVGTLPPKAKPMVEIAAKNCERLVRLVSDILDVEKIASGHMTFKYRTLPLFPLIAQVIEANRGFGTSLGVTLRQESEAGDVRVHADGDRLAQVLTNLISNACQFSPRGETVTVRILRQGDKVRVAVEDQGPGIPEEFHSRIFQKFAQADSADGTQKKGTGLGLAISKGLIEKMGGTIGFVTRSGAGTTFFFDLSLETAPPASSESPHGTRPRILICEDERDIAEVLRALLDREGFESDRAATLKEARRLLGRRSYAGVTLDLSLPDGNGLHLLQELRLNRATARLPVIVISAHLEENSQDLRGHAFGLVDWLEKPISEDRLREALRSCVQGTNKRPRVLHIEDDPDICQVVADLLRETAEVVQAGTVLSAWDRLREEDFDLMIIDLGLPDGSGLELLPALRRTTQTPIPSLVFSAHEISPRTEKYVSAALLKSKTSNEELVARVRHLLGKPAAALAGSQALGHD